jgi:lanosterol synthase
MDCYNAVDVPADISAPFTDYARWRLRSSDSGRHTWHHLSDAELASWPQTELDKYWLGIPTGIPALPTPKTPLEAARNGYSFYKHLQAEDGHWPGEYGGPMFLMGGLVIGSYVTGMPFKHEERLEMIRYLLNRAHPEDGGWGLHIEGHSTVFGTSLNYVALRILGVPAEHPAMVKARGTLHKLGGATGAPAWGKFWLSILGVYEWEGNNCTLPELWLFPDWVPFHPHKWWIHVRTVHVPMTYLHGVRFTHPLNDLTRALRQVSTLSPRQRRGLIYTCTGTLYPTI